MRSARKRIVIVGGGFAGIGVANALKDSGAEIILIDKSNHYLFQPLLYQVATAALSPGDIAAPLRAILGGRKKVKVLLGEVQKIHKNQKHLRLLNGKCLSFDQLILAPGVQYNYFGNDNWKQFAPGLKTLRDALNIRERLLLSLEEAEQVSRGAMEKDLTYVIIGGGPTGVETAGAIAEIARTSMRRNYKNINEEDVKIYLIEAAPTILNGFKEPLRNKAEIMLKQLGVTVVLGSPVVKIEKNKVFLEDKCIETSNIIWAAGIKAPNFLAQLDAEQDKLGRVIVKEDLSLPGNPDIFVLGDAAHFKDKTGNPLPAMASVAKQQGEYLGKILAANQNGNNQVRSAFKYKDKGTMATVGRARAVAEYGHFSLSGFTAWFLWSSVHVLLLIGFRNRWRVLSEWVWNYFTFKRGVQLITDRSQCHNCSMPDDDLQLRIYDKELEVGV